MIRVGGRAAARRKKNAEKQQSLSLEQSLGFGWPEDEAEKGLHSTVFAYEVHVEKFLAQLPTLHRRDQAKEFFQLTRVRHTRTFTAAYSHPSRIRNFSYSCTRGLTLVYTSPRMVVAGVKIDSNKTGIPCF